MRKTTAEIQNYSFESKLDRDANSKDSGISQMGGEHHHLHASANGFNGHARLVNFYLNEKSASIKANQLCSIFHVVPKFRLKSVPWSHEFDSHEFFLLIKILKFLCSSHDKDDSVYV